MKSIYYIMLLISLLARPTLAQIGITGTPHPSAVLDLKATDKVFYPPRLTTVQRKAIANPQAGALVFDTDKTNLYLHDGQNWLPMRISDPSIISPLIRTYTGTDTFSFGHSVAISGEYAFVGNPDKNNQGAVHVFKRSTSAGAAAWTEQAILTPSDPAYFRNFGSSVAIDGTYAVVGSKFRSNTEQSTAYVFALSGTTWSQQAILAANDPENYDEFGNSVAISGDYVVVGVSAKTVGSAVGQGAAYVFARSGTNWTQQAKLTDNQGNAGSQFGFSVAISGDYALIGAPQSSGHFAPYYTQQGLAVVFSRSGTIWAQQTTLTLPAADATSNRFFGWSVGLSGNYAVVGINTMASSGQTVPGAAYVFERTNSGIWLQPTKLIAPDETWLYSYEFGQSVAISGDYLIIGRQNYTPGNVAYIFKRNGTSWGTFRNVSNIPYNSLDSNGTSVSIANGTFIIGSDYHYSNTGKVSISTIDN